MTTPDTPTPLKGEIEDTAQAPDLCTHCGLCCMGAIHDRAVLDEDELQPASDIGLPVKENSPRLAFTLPCPKLSGSACSIFGRRPRVCSRYQCQVLQDFRTGVLSFERARAKVAYARKLVASLETRLPVGMKLPEARRLVNLEFVPNNVMDREILLGLRLHATALELYLDKNFRGTKDGQALVMTPVAKD